ncbi:MAG: permease [Firmicutes bacterium]|nr:permease [Bacillota bacterium]MDH7496783.1 permease [Bacillota bacterium]
MDLNTISTAGKFFLAITAELVVLFIAISFLVGLIQQLVPEETVGRILSRSLKGWRGNILGALFGALTPFCSCSTIPVLVGLLNGGAPFGSSMSFLIASPILNPVIIGLLLALLGLKVTTVYAVFSFMAAVVTGALWERMGLAREVKRVKILGGKRAQEQAEEAVAGEKAETCVGVIRRKLECALRQAAVLFRQVLPYLLIGAAIGSFIYGWVPRELVVRLAGEGNPLAVPIAAVIGVPLYIRAETVIPISSVLVDKGMSIGTVMALVLGGAGASIPEVLLLNAIFRKRLVVAFVITIFVVATVAGYLFNMLL